jgi:MFS family permease
MTKDVAPAGRLVLLFVLTFLVMLPETLPVPVLRGLVVDRFAVGDGMASLFLAANMLGGLATVPFVGLWVDRTGRRRRLTVLLLLLDALCMQALAHPLDYGTFLSLRAAEGACHLGALTLLMSLVADAHAGQRGRALGAVGAGLTLGVATGAAVGGVLGRNDPLATLHVASAVLGAAAAVAAFVLPRDVGPSRQRHGYLEVARAVAGEPAMRLPLTLALLDRFTVGFFTTGFPLLLASRHQAPPAVIGALLAAFLYPFALLSYPFGRAAERWSRRRMVAFGSLAYGLAMAAVGAVPAALLWLVMPVCGIASAVMFVPTLLWLLDRAPAVGRSTTMAAFHAAGSLGFLLGPVCCGALIEAGGPERGYLMAFVVGGATQVLGAGLVLRGVRG